MTIRSILVICVGVWSCTSEQDPLALGPDPLAPGPDPFESDTTSVGRRGELLQTDTLFYVAAPRAGRYGFDVVARFTNTSADTVFLARCYPDSRAPTYGVQLIGQSDPWGAAYNGFWACVGHENPIAVAPGKVREDTIPVMGPNAWGGLAGQPYGVFEGVFRLQYGVNSCRKEIGCEITGSGLSNTFRVRRQN
jgi:hypothetical protein